MNKEKYEKAELEIIGLQIEDVITISDEESRYESPKVT